MPRCLQLLLLLLQAVGEPPLGLATTVFFAIKDAIASARNDAGLNALFTLHCPATAERIRLACVDDFIKQVGFDTAFLLHVVLIDEGLYSCWYCPVRRTGTYF